MCTACGKCCTRFFGRDAVTMTIDDFSKLYNKVLVLGNIYFNGPLAESVQYVMEKHAIGDPGLSERISDFCDTQLCTLDINRSPYSLTVQAQIVMVPLPNGSCPLLQNNMCGAYLERPYVCRLFPLTSWMPLDVVEAVTVFPEDCATGDDAPPFLDGERVLDEGYARDLEELGKISARRKKVTSYILASPDVRNNIDVFIKNALIGKRSVSTDIIPFVDAAIELGALRSEDRKTVILSQIKLASERIGFYRENKIKNAREVTAQLKAHIDRYESYLAYLG